jgi:hypothetical protein
MWRAALLVFAACGDGGPGPRPIVVGDGRPLPDAPQTMGTHYHYVVDRLLLPTSAAQALEYGLDLDGDGVVNNQFGAGAAALASAGFDVQGVMDREIADGSIILLLDLQTDDLTSSHVLSGLRIFVGSQPMPSPCSGPADAICGHHLDGAGRFAIPPSPFPPAPYDVLEGSVIDSVFTGAADEEAPPFEIALIGNLPLGVPVDHMRVVASGITPATIDSVVIGGAFRITDWDDGFGAGLVGAFASELESLVAFDCTTLTSPPGCGCTNGSLGQHILAYFEPNPTHCNVTHGDVARSAFGQLTPDVQLASGNGIGISIGVKLTAVAASFDEPGGI